MTNLLQEELKSLNLPYPMISEAPKFKAIQESCCIGEKLDEEKVTRLVLEEKEKRYVAIDNHHNIYLMQSDVWMNYQVYKGVKIIERAIPQVYKFAKGTAALQPKKQKQEFMGWSK